MKEKELNYAWTVVNDVDKYNKYLDIKYAGFKIAVGGLLVASIGLATAIFGTRKVESTYDDRVIFMNDSAAKDWFSTMFDFACNDGLGKALDKIKEVME